VVIIHVSTVEIQLSKWSFFVLLHCNSVESLEFIELLFTEEETQTVVTDDDDDDDFFTLRSPDEPDTVK